MDGIKRFQATRDKLKAGLDTKTDSEVKEPEPEHVHVWHKFKSRIPLYRGQALVPADKDDWLVYKECQCGERLKIDILRK